MGSIHHIAKFIPSLAEKSEPLRPLLKKDNTATSNKLKWEEKHTITFSKVKTQISKIVENKNFDVDKETRVKCVAKKTGIRCNFGTKSTKHLARYCIRKQIFKPGRTKI